MERKLRGFFKKMSDNELKDYIKENHRGISPRELSRIDSRAYTTLIKRKLVNEFVSDGILVKRNKRTKPPSFFSNMSDKEIMQYAINNHRGDSLRMLSRKCNSLYNEVTSRDLKEKLVEGGILVRKNQKAGIYSQMNDEEIIDFIKGEYNGIGITEFMKTNKTAYSVAHERNLIAPLVKEGVLILKNGQWRNLDFCLEQAILMMKENSLSKFPGSWTLKKLGYGSLASAINKYYGFSAFREKLNGQMGQSSCEGNQLESLLDGYIGGEEQ